MQVTDLAAQVRAQVQKAIEAADDGHEYGVAVSWQQALGQDGAPAIAWGILVTTRHPVLGHPPIAMAATLTCPSVPREHEVAGAVRQVIPAIRGLYDTAERQEIAAASTGNGHAPLPGRVT